MASTYLVLGLGVVLNVTNGFAQQADGSSQLRSVEVASVRRHLDTDQQVGRLTVSGSTVTVRNFSLYLLVLEAYGRKEYEVSGAGDFNGKQGRDETYDVTVEAEGDAPLTREQGLSILQSVLLQRFNLGVHHETRESPVYLLVLAKGSQKLKQSSPDGTFKANIDIGRTTRLTYRHVSLDQLARALAPQAGRPVLDKTGLTGFYDLALEWTRDNIPAQIPEGIPTGNESSAPSLFTAVQEQLGLKLQPATAPIDVLVVDHFEKPSPN